MTSSLAGVRLNARCFVSPANAQPPPLVGEFRQSDEGA
jgi:hypothetical protein